MKRKLKPILYIYMGYIYIYIFIAMKFWTYGSKEKNYETIGEHSGSGYIYRIRIDISSV